VVLHQWEVALGRQVQPVRGLKGDSYGFALV